MSIKIMQMDICDGCADLDLKTEHHFSDNQLLYTQVLCKNYYICNRAYEAGEKNSTGDDNISRRILMTPKQVKRLSKYLKKCVKKNKGVIK